MDTKKIFEGSDELAAKARAFVEAAGAFFGEMAKTGNGLDLALMELDKVSEGLGVDYDAPVMDAYKKVYRPITAGEIANANKEMTQAIAGEKWVEGFMTCVQLIMMFKP